LIVENYAENLYLCKTTRRREKLFLKMLIVKLAINELRCLFESGATNVLLIKAIEQRESQ